MDVVLIAAVTADGYIARHSQEVIRWSRDLSLFKRQTQGWPVVMGSNTKMTLEQELTGREIIVVHRNDDPEKILSSLKADKCFIAGGGKTNARFGPYLTHLYLTIHPLIFGKGVPLFNGLKQALSLTLDHMEPVKEAPGLYQFQYRVNRDIGHNP